MPDFALDSRRFGVELEFVGATRRQVAAALARSGLTAEVESYNHQVRNYWKVTTDASVGNYNQGGELVSPPLRGPLGRRDVAVACRALHGVGGRVLRTCGMHVHHEVEDLDAAAIIRAIAGYYESQEAIDGLVSQDRRSSSFHAYCRALSAEELRMIRQARNLAELRVQADYVNRFRTINVACFPRFGTVEIRQHGGTVDANKVLAWIAFGQSLFAAAAAGVELQASTPEDLIAVLSEHGNLDSGAAEFLRTRATLFRRATEELASRR